MEVMKIYNFTKFQVNISIIMPAKLENTGTWGVNTTVDLMMHDYNYMACLIHDLPEHLSKNTVQCVISSHYYFCI